MRRPKYRTVEGLLWAKTLNEWPRQIPQKPPRRGSKRAGIRFEQEVWKALEKGGLRPRHGQWFEYTDMNGYGLCQVDLVFATGGIIYIVECKLSDAKGGQGQLKNLYLPVCRMVFSPYPVRGIVCVKSLRGDIKASSVCQDVSVAMTRTVQPFSIPVLQYLGRGPI